MDMWAPYAKAVGGNAPRAQVLFDRFHLVQHRNHAVDEVRRSRLRRLSRKEKVTTKLAFQFKEDLTGLARSFCDYCSSVGPRWSVVLLLETGRGST